MKQAAVKTTQSPSSKNPSVLGAIGMDALNVSWRIAVPVVIAAVAGIMADRAWGTEPWVTLVSVVLGFVVAGWLVKRQIAELEALEKEDEKE
jgi:F0F1-type ATP synthase assembly protein I